MSFSMTQPLLVKIISSLLPMMTLATITVFPNRIVFFSALGVWIGYTTFLFLRYRTSVYDTATQAMTMCSLVLLLVFMESPFLRWFFVVASFFVFFFLIWMSSEHTGWLVHIKERPLRRIRMMIHVFNLYAWLVALYAVSVFFPSIPFWVLSLLGGGYGSLITVLIWRLYFKSLTHELLLPALVVALIIIELMWTVRLTPFGYLAEGLIVVWLWYGIQLFGRFYLSTRGVMWKKQAGFIVGNVVLFICVLFFIRWI